MSKVDSVHISNRLINWHGRQRLISINPNTSVGAWAGARIQWEECGCESLGWEAGAGVS